jgi:hypothetical protein
MAWSDAVSTHHHDLRHPASSPISAAAGSNMCYKAWLLAPAGRALDMTFPLILVDCASLIFGCAFLF